LPVYSASSTELATWTDGAWATLNRIEDQVNRQMATYFQAAAGLANTSPIHDERVVLVPAGSELPAATWIALEAEVMQHYVATRQPTRFVAIDTAAGPTVAQVYTTGDACTVTTSTITSTNAMANYVVTDAGVTLVNNFTQPLTRLYAASSGNVVTTGPYVGWDEQAALRAWEAACRQSGQPRHPIERLSPAVIRLRRKRIQHAGRRTLRRSIDNYARWRGYDEISRFLRGLEITLPGHEFDYRVTKTKSVLAHSIEPTGGHIPYKLEVAPKGMPEAPSYASGCVYFERTPVIDQILAVALHVGDPDDERRLLGTTNWTYNPSRNRADRAIRERLAELSRRSGREDSLLARQGRRV
jgi:hypothetical protein